MLGGDFHDSSCKQNEVICAGIQQSEKKENEKNKKRALRYDQLLQQNEPFQVQ